ncbi:MAG: hypothetical protein ACP5IK_00330 [Candidatus Micrarchaeia archaeon]
MHDSLLEKVIYKIVKRHIAGTTISSAIKKVRELNARGLPATVTFLSNSVNDLAKARYVASTYSQLVQQIGRSGLKATVHVPLNDIGFSISESQALNYLQSIIQLSNKFGVFVWGELPEESDASLLDGLARRGLGLAVNAEKWETLLRTSLPAKLVFKTNNSHDDKKALEKRLVGIEKLLKRGQLVLSFPDEGLTHALTKNAKYKSSLIFEFQLGYANKELSRLAQKGWKVSVYVPFGKGWANFALTRIQGKYTHLIAKKLLERGKYA